MRVFFLWLFLVAGLVLPAAAQVPPPPATLIADAIRFDRPTQTLTAQGGVEVFYGTTTLRAARITYDGANDQLEVEGPLTLIDETGNAVFLAEFAALSGDLQRGVLRSARLVLDRELQIAATEISRTDVRYTQAYQVVASSCEVCEENPTPLWEIRAARVIHDQETRNLWFEQAQFRALGVPLAYFPRLRLPDPTLERASGFLVPEVFGNGTIGTGLRVPYFQTLGAHRDLTFAPYRTTSGYGGLGLRYRQAFQTGWLEFNGQLSFDELTRDSYRGYLFGDGYLQLPRGFGLELAVRGVTDEGYLTTYGISEADRLRSHATIARITRDELIEARLVEYNSLRDGDDNRTLPNSILDAEWVRRSDIGWGVGQLGLSLHSRERDSNADQIGRDLARMGLEAAWRSDLVGPAGLVFALEAGTRADVFAINQDSRFEDLQTRVAPMAGAEMSWPLARLNSESGVHHLITPRLQFAWSDDGAANLPNGDSAIVSFDEANLFALDRFPGNDQVESGGRMALGLSYERSDPTGWSFGGTLGRVWRQDDLGQFNAGSGLDGATSDWLLAVHYRMNPNLQVINRALIEDNFSFTSNEAAIAWTGNRHDLTGTVTWLAADAAESRPDDTAELYLAGGYDLGEGWRAQADWRYDFARNETARASLRLSYATECVNMRFSLSRRFTSSTTVEPSTELGLRVALNGFGATRDGRSRARLCRN